MKKERSSQDYYKIDLAIRVLKEKIISNPAYLLYVVSRFFRHFYEVGIVNKNYKIVDYIRGVLNNTYLHLAVFISSILKQSLFFVAGDSHVREFNRRYPFVAFHLGAVTAHNLIEKKSSTDSNKKLEDVLKFINKKKDYLILSAGEVDVRAHINKNVILSGGKVTISQSVDFTVKRYLSLVKSLQSRGYSVIILGIVPITTRANYFKVKHFASTKKRIYIYNLFNSKLSTACAKNNIVYLDIYNNTVGKDGFALAEYYLDGVHLNRKVVDLVKMLLKLEKVNVGIN